MALPLCIQGMVSTLPQNRSFIISAASTILPGKTNTLRGFLSGVAGGGLRRANCFMNGLPVILRLFRQILVVKVLLARTP